MTDLTDEELDHEWSIEGPRHEDWPGRRMIIEIRRHRTARVADEERVRSVIFEAGEFVLNSDVHVKVYPADAERLADAIAARAAKQLATACVELSDEDVTALREVRRSIVCTAKSCHDQGPYVPQITALDRLLATRSAS